MNMGRADYVIVLGLTIMALSVVVMWSGQLARGTDLFLLVGGATILTAGSIMDTQRRFRERGPE